VLFENAIYTARSINVLFVKSMITICFDDSPKISFTGPDLSDSKCTKKGGV
jgi:hypothetical protein